MEEKEEGRRGGKDQSEGSSRYKLVFLAGQGVGVVIPDMGST